MPTNANSVDTADASAIVFLTAFRALGPAARRQVLKGLIDSTDLREDFEATLLWEERKDEPRRSFREYLAACGER
jgi:hypothetical protein